MTTIRQTIITNLISALQGITITNGYETDVGLNVFEWLQYSTDATVRPCLIVKDVKDYPEKNTDPISDRRLDIEIIAEADGTNAIADVRKIIGDVFVAIVAGGNFGGKVYWIEDTEVTMACIHEEDIIAGASIKFTFYYETEYMNPYNTRNV